MEELSGGIKKDENRPASCGDPCNYNRKVCGLFYVHNMYTWLIIIKGG